MNSQQNNAGTLLAEQNESEAAVGPAVHSPPATPASQHLLALAKEPLWKLQRRALVDQSAATECARRFVATSFSGRVLAYQERIVECYLAGLRAEPNRYGQNYGGNFTSRLRGAYQAGKQLRDELTRDGFGVVEVIGEVR